MTLALDGTPVTATGSSVVSLAFPAFTTTNSNTVVMVAALINGTQITSITDSLGTLVWARRATTGLTDPIETWYAVAAAPLSGVVITLHHNSTAFVAGCVFAVSGANTGAPFDANVSLPATVSSGSAVVSTSSANTFVFGAYRTIGASPIAGAGFTLIAGANFNLTEYKIVASTQTSLTVPLNGAETDNGGIGDAIVAAAGAGAGSAKILLLGVGSCIVRRDFRPIRALLGGRES